MSNSLEKIQAPIIKEMIDFEKKFRESVKTDVWLLDNIMNYIIQGKGKQMRPMFVFLAAGMCKSITEATYRGAAMIELLHTATLLHDDVVDDSHYRRGFFSINALWKNKASVLSGDFLLAKGLLLSIDNNDFELLRIMSSAVRDMSEGELLQLQKSRTLDITETVYFEIIRRKTATLIAACCGVGASSSGVEPEIVQKMIRFGETIGIAFQIKDDLFDYGTAEIGKPVGIDIKEKKMTLPLIFALNQASKSEKRAMINLIKNESEKPKKVAEVIDFVKKTGGIAYTNEVMHKYYQEAEQILVDFPESVFKTSLRDLVKFTIERSK
jgi:octaprenyl-diphosphate synthase